MLLPSDISLGKIYLPSELINSSYKYQVRFPSSTGVPIPIIRVYTYLDNHDVYSDCSSTNCVYHDVMYYNNNYFITVQMGKHNGINNYPLMTSDRFTDNIFYRPDFNDSLFIFFIYLILLIYLPFKIFSRLFGRWLKL